MARRQKDGNGAELVPGSAAERYWQEGQVQAAQQIAAPPQTGVNTYWGGTTSDQTRQHDDLMRQQDLNRIALINDRRDTLSAQRDINTLAHPMALLSGQEQREQLFNELKDKNKKSLLDTQTAEETLDQSKKVSAYMTPDNIKKVFDKKYGVGQTAAPVGQSVVTKPGAVAQDPDKSAFDVWPDEAKPFLTDDSSFAKRTPMESIMSTLDEFWNTESGRPQLNTATTASAAPPAPSPQTRPAMLPSTFAVPNRQMTDRLVPWNAQETRPADPIIFGDDAFDKIIGPDGIPRFKSKRKNTVAFP